MVLLKQITFGLSTFFKKKVLNFNSISCGLGWNKDTRTPSSMGLEFYFSSSFGIGTGMRIPKFYGFEFGEEYGDTKLIVVVGTKFYGFEFEIL
jgi:hypothetical protein